MFNAFQSHACPLIMILFQFHLFFISEIQLRNIVFHTFYSYLLDFIKIRTEHFALKQMLCYLRMDISFEVRANAISLIANIIIFFSKTYPSFLSVKEGVFLPLRLSCKESSTFLTKPLFPQEREDVVGSAIALPRFWSASGACAFVRKPTRPSLPLRKAPPLISVFSPQGRRGKPPYSVLGTATL